MINDNTVTIHNSDFIETTAINAIPLFLLLKSKP